MTEFDQAWANYPRRVAKGAARRAWEKAARAEPALLAKVLEALAWQVEVFGWDGGHYTPHFSTYLNQERWTDEHPALAQRVRRAVQADADAEWLARRKQIEADEDARLRRMREGV